MSTPEQEWQKLCDEHEAARDAVFKAISPVIKKQGARARGESQVNLAEAELDAMFAAQEKWGAVQRRMDAFIEQHFGKKKS